MTSTERLLVDGTPFSDEDVMAAARIIRDETGGAPVTLGQGLAVLKRLFAERARFTVHAPPGHPSTMDTPTAAVAAVLPPCSGDPAVRAPADLVGRTVNLMVDNGICVVHVVVAAVQDEYGETRLCYQLPEQHGDSAVSLHRIAHVYVFGTADEPVPRYAAATYVHWGDAEGHQVRARAEGLAAVLADLDRCPHGRHQGDTCAGWDGIRPESGCEGGQSLGNTTLPPAGFRVGTGRAGDPITVPPRGQRHDPAAWRQPPTVPVVQL